MVAYICQQFPALTQTFTYRTLLEISHSLPLVLYSAKEGDSRFEPEGTPEQELLDSDLLQLTRTAPPLKSLDLIKSVVRCIGRSPRGALGQLGYVLRHSHGTLTGLRRLRPVVEWARALWIIEDLHQNRIRPGRLHAEFAGSDCTMAWIISRLTGIPFSFTSHTSLYEPFLVQKVSDAEFVVAISAFERQRLVRLCGPHVQDKIHIVRLGVDTDLWSPSGSDASEEPTLVVSVGSLFEKKGHEFLIRATAALARSGIKLKCWIIGDGPRRNFLEYLIDDLGIRDRVTLLGAMPVNRVRSTLQQSTFFVLPCVESANEGTDGIPVSIMEAMSLGKPCISTPTAGIPELIKDGINGILVAPRDTAALALAMKRLSDNHSLRKRLGRAARETVIDEFDIRKNSQDLVPLLGHHAERSPE